MKTKYLFVMLLTLCAVGTMKAQSCDPINVTASRPHIENFSTTDWPHPNTTNNYDLFADYPQNCWHVPYTIVAADGTPSPRLWYNGEAAPRHISLKEGGSQTDDQYVLFPVFGNPIKDLNIQFKANINNSGERTLYIGYYDTETQEFTQLNEVSVLYNTEYRDYGPYDLNENGDAPAEFDGKYRLAFCYPGNADGFSCDITEITVGAYLTTINSNADWETFCNHINEGQTYPNRTVTLGSNIQISKMAGDSKSPYHSFQGTFNGQGHQLILNGGDFGTAVSPAEDANIAPFRYVWGATIASLEVTGHIYTSNQKAAGFVAVAGDGDLTFTNCRSSVNIHSSRNGDGTHGGFIALLQGDSFGTRMTATFTNCAFTGSITTTNNTTNVGGFVGWCEWNTTDSNSGRCTLVLNNCVVAPNAPCISTDSKTFARFRDETSSTTIDGASTIRNCYYNQTIGDPQGKLRYTITSELGVTVALAGDAIIYNVSQITAYDGNEGLRYNDTLWAGENDNVNLLLGYYGMGSVTSYTSDQCTLTYTGEGNLDGTDDPHTLTMPASDVTIGATYSGDQGQFIVCDGSDHHGLIPIDNQSPMMDQHTQMIYPADKLALLVGTEIHQMTFYSANSSLYLDLYRWTVALRVTEATTLSEFDPSTDTTQIYSGYLHIVNGTLTITFNDPFYYGGGNLLMDFRHIGISTLDGQRKYYFMGVSAPLGSSYTDRFNEGQESFLAKVKFDYRVPTSTPKPSHLTVSNITDHSATVSWMAPSYTTPIRYEYHYSPVGGGSGGGAGVGAPTSIDLSTLQEYTTYNFMVRAIYEGSSASDYIYTTFTTRSIPVEVGDNWEEDFENIHTNVWEFYDGYFPEKARWARGNAVNNGGDRSIYVTNDGGTTNAYTYDHKLVVYAAKLLHFTKGKFTFSFDWKCVGEKTEYGNYYDYLQVGLVPGSVAITADSVGSDRPTGWVRLHDEEFLCGSNTWQTTPDKTITVATTGDYYLVLRWRQDNGDGGSPAAVDNIHITRMFCENDVTGLAASTFTSSSAILNWDDDEGISGWQVAYSTDPNFPEEGTTMVEVTVNSYSMTNLLAGTTYYAKVRTHCSEVYGYGEWCNAIEVNTKCEYITQFPWKEGFEIYKDFYNPYIIFSDFCWVNENISGTHHEVFRVLDNSWGGSYHVENGNNTNQILMPDESRDAKALLVLPGMTLPEGTTHNYYRFALDIWRTKDPYLYPSGEFLNEGIRVFASTDDVLDEETDRELGFIPRHIYGNSATIPQVENEGYYNYSLPIGEWGDGPCYIILVGITKGYDPIYMDNFEVSVIPNTFTNSQGNHQWSTLDNWWPKALGIPNVTDNVEIEAEAVIPYDYVAKANKITIKDGGSIVMENGAQLWHGNEAVRATVKKRVFPFQINSNEGFVFISSPIVEEIDPTGVDMMFPENTTVDLYRFNQSANLEWENWKAEETDHYHFNLEHGRGYLYAHNYIGGFVDLGFDGYIKPSTEPVNIPLVYDSGHEFTGWNLIGNPLVCNATIGRPFYIISGNSVVPNTGSEIIAPCTGVLVQATNEDDTVVFTKHDPSIQTSQPENDLQITLAQANTRSAKMLDKAIVSFNEGVQLEKFYFGNGAKVYIPQGGKDYAIASVGTDVARNVSTIPVNFKATENGEYTLTVNSEGVEMNYLHLIDNMTGADVDLLVYPNYSFDARTTDYESRFRLVFASNNEDGSSTGSENFAFYSNGNWFIANEGDATLQVIDVTGRILSSETISGSISKTIDVAPGVYILKLNDKVQKIVIR